MASHCGPGRTSGESWPDDSSISTPLYLSLLPFRTDAPVAKDLAGRLPSGNYYKDFAQALEHRALQIELRREHSWGLHPPIDILNDTGSANRLNRLDQPLASVVRERRSPNKLTSSVSENLANYATGYLLYDLIAERVRPSCGISPDPQIPCHASSRAAWVGQKNPLFKYIADASSIVDRLLDLAAIFESLAEQTHSGSCSQIEPSSNKDGATMRVAEEIFAFEGSKKAMIVLRNFSFVAFCINILSKGFPYLPEMPNAISPSDPRWTPSVWDNVARVYKAAGGVRPLRQALQLVVGLTPFVLLAPLNILKQGICQEETAINTTYRGNDQPSVVRSMESDLLGALLQIAEGSVATLPALMAVARFWKATGMKERVVASNMDRFYYKRDSAIPYSKDMSPLHVNVQLPVPPSWPRASELGRYTLAARPPSSSGSQLPAPLPTTAALPTAAPRPPSPHAGSTSRAANQKSGRVVNGCGEGSTPAPLPCAPVVGGVAFSSEGCVDGVVQDALRAEGSPGSGADTSPNQGGSKEHPSSVGHEAGVAVVGVQVGEEASQQPSILPISVINRGGERGADNCGDSGLNKRDPAPNELTLAVPGSQGGGLVIGPGIDLDLLGLPPFSPMSLDAMDDKHEWAHAEANALVNSDGEEELVDEGLASNESSPEEDVDEGLASNESSPEEDVEDPFDELDSSAAGSEGETPPSPILSRPKDSSDAESGRSGRNSGETEGDEEESDQDVVKPKRSTKGSGRRGKTRRSNAPREKSDGGLKSNTHNGTGPMEGIESIDFDTFRRKNKAERIRIVKAVKATPLVVISDSEEDEPIPRLVLEGVTPKHLETDLVEVCGPDGRVHAFPLSVHHASYSSSLHRLFQASRERGSNAPPLVEFFSHESAKSLTPSDFQRLFPMCAVVIYPDDSQPALDPGFTTRSLENIEHLSHQTEMQDQSILVADGEYSKWVRTGSLEDLHKAAVDGDGHGKALNGLNFPDPYAGLETGLHASDIMALRRTRGEAGCPRTFDPSDVAFRLVATEGAFHLPHIDNCGDATWLVIVTGEKVWFFLEPKDPSKISSNRLWTARDLDLSNLDLSEWHVQAVLLTPGTKMYMPPAMTHAAYTKRHCICVGGHFLPGGSLVRVVIGLIHTFFQGKVITNTLFPPTFPQRMNAMACYYYKVFCLGEVSSSDEGHYPDIFTHSGLMDLVIFACAIELQNTLCPLSYKTTQDQHLIHMMNSRHAGNRKGRRDALQRWDINALPHQARLGNILARGRIQKVVGAAFEAIIITDSTGAKQDPWSYIFYPTLARLMAGITDYMDRARAFARDLESDAGEGDAATERGEVSLFSRNISAVASRFPKAKLDALVRRFSRSESDRANPIYPMVEFVVQKATRPRRQSVKEDVDEEALLKLGLTDCDALYLPARERFLAPATRHDGVAIAGDKRPAPASERQGK